MTGPSEPTWAEAACTSANTVKLVSVDVLEDAKPNANLDDRAARAVGSAVSGAVPYRMGAAVGHRGWRQGPAISARYTDRHSAARLLGVRRALSCPISNALNER